jgi:uncharacterized damage-inducible protein DinB
MAMPPRWTERTFRFDLPLDHGSLVLERLRGLPARVEDKARRLSPSLLTRRDGDAWSIQEHIGHLLDLDELHAGRIDDYLSGAEVLRAADMGNRRTWEASHNDRPVADILEELRRERDRFIQRLEDLGPERLGLTALHPRLGQPMRVLDMALFVAEHDDHHLAWMTELARRSGPRSPLTSTPAPAGSPG